ncbi:MAG: ATP-binding protein [Flavisolibacter sp.]
MKCLLKILLLLFPMLMQAQENTLDSLRGALATSTQDSSRYLICRRIYDYYEETNRDSAYYYAGQSLQLARRNNEKLAEVLTMDNLAYQSIGLGRFANALQYLLDAFKIAQDQSNDKEITWELFSHSFKALVPGSNRLLVLAYTHHIYGILMLQTDNNDQATVHFTKARELSSKIGHGVRQMMADMNLGRCYMAKNQLDSALMFEDEAEQLASTTNFKKYLGQVYSTKASIYLQKRDEEKALQFFRKAIETSIKQMNLNALSAHYFYLTKFFLEKKQRDSALDYAKRDLEVIRQLGPVTGLTVNIGTVLENVYLCYKMGGPHDSLFKYQGLTLAAKDSLYRIRIKSLTDFQNVTLNEQLRLQNLEKEKLAYQNKVRTYFFIAGISVLLLLSAIFYYNNLQKHKAKARIEKAYAELKATQAQLIQSEKMASLGELTAGIAHEIQNPLNFVNNFAEINTELIGELNEGLSKGNLDEVKAITDDLKDNNQKIAFHGKRADSIVKGMLQHSRASSGKKELTDINALADEFLRLSYHGLRAKDKSFNAAMETSFDYNLEKVLVIPQDLGRVLLNLFNNAFYSVNEKKKSLNGLFEPRVFVGTGKIGDSVEIIVKDNGNGIPQKVLDKIYQPFFTTKPTGEGTGLGLSMSYDIITKGHRGELKVESKEGEFASFKIILPIKS